MLMTAKEMKEFGIQCAKELAVEFVDEWVQKVAMSQSEKGYIAGYIDFANKSILLQKYALELLESLGYSTKPYPSKDRIFQICWCELSELV